MYLSCINISQAALGLTLVCFDPNLIYYCLFVFCSDLKN